MWKSFFVLAVLFPALVTASSEDREWTDGARVFTVEASFVELDGKTVLLRKPNGVVVEVPLERFSEADKRYLSSLPGVDVPPTNEAIDRIERALDRKWAFDFVDTPLDDVVKFLAEHGEMDVRLDRRAMDDRGLVPSRRSPCRTRPDHWPRFYP